MDSRRARVVELRVFGGLSVAETAELLHISPQSVMRDWRHSVGLGLFIARAIVSGHFGHIEVRSSTNEGTTFTVALPKAF